MSELNYQYEGNPVDFGFNHDLMVNATEMTKVFDKKVSEFLKLENTKKLIKALERSQIRLSRKSDSNSPAINGAIDGTTKHKSADMVPLVVIVRGGENGGSTWLHRYLAIELAAWLDIDFKIWTLRIIDALLSNYTNEKRNLALRKRSAENQLQKILHESENDDVKVIDKILKELNQIKGEEFNINKNFKKNLFNQ